MSDSFANLAKFVRLGASLYVPTTRDNLESIGLGEQFPELRSVIFCTEDSVLERDLSASLRRLKGALQGFAKALPRTHQSLHYQPLHQKPLSQKPLRHQPLRFVRPRNPEVLAEILAMPGSEMIDGFVLPKINVSRLKAYMDVLKDTNFHVQLTLETRETFSEADRCALRASIIGCDLAERVLALRIGGNDLLNLLGLRRPTNQTIYDTPIGTVISSLVTTFKPFGFFLTAPVFEGLGNPAALKREVELDLAHGLFGKTAIHPDQIPAIECHYRVCAKDIEMAEAILETDAPAVFRLHDLMCEPATHRHWAALTLARAEVYGREER